MLLTLLACIHVHEDFQTFTPTEPFSAVSVDLGSSDITIAGAERTRLVRRIAWSGPGDVPEVDAPVVIDGELVLDQSCQGPLICEVEWAIEVPAEVSVRVHLGSGDAAVRCVDGDITVETGSGDIDVDTIAGDLDASTGSGDIDVRAASGAIVRAESGSGDVTLEILEAGEVAATTGSGDVSIAAPAGAWALDLSTGSGDLDVERISDDPRAGRRLTARTGSGDVAVSGR